MVSASAWQGCRSSDRPLITGTLAVCASSTIEFVLSVTTSEVIIPKTPIEVIFTSFTLEQEQVDLVISTGKNLLRQNPEYMRLLKNLGVTNQ